MVILFTYIGRVLTTSENYWKVGVANLLMLQWIWARLSRISGWERSDPRAFGTLNKTVVQATLFVYRRPG